MAKNNWFVVRSKPKQEQRALANLENQGINSFLPHLTVIKIRRGKRTKVTEPMFPGYLFVQLDDFNSDFHKIRSTFGVSKVLMFGQQPATLPQALIEDMQNLEQNPAQESPATQAKDTPYVGDTAEIVSGPFRGLIGKIIQLDGDERCIVLLDWLQQQVKATFNYDELRKT